MKFNVFLCRGVFVSSAERWKLGVYDPSIFETGKFPAYGKNAWLQQMLPRVLDHMHCRLSWFVRASVKKPSGLMLFPVIWCSAPPIVKSDASTQSANLAVGDGWTSSVACTRLVYNAWMHVGPLQTKWLVYCHFCWFPISICTRSFVFVPYWAGTFGKSLIIPKISRAL